MKYAVMMTVHNNPLQVKRLCKILENENCYFYIHVDKKSDFSIFEKELSDIPRLLLYSEVRVYWGNISQVDATVSLLRKIKKDHISYAFFISGQDYLIQKDNNLLNHVDTNKNYLEFFELPHKEWSENGRTDRYKYRYNILNFSDKIVFNARNRYYNFLDRKLVNLQKKMNIKRKFYSDFKPYAGANWFNINEKAIDIIINEYPKLRRYFKFVKLPDEMIVQTILLNSVVKKDCINDCKRYVDWYSGPEQPRTLTVDDYNKIIKSNDIFARKFDYNKDTDILNKLDRYRGE